MREGCLQMAGRKAQGTCLGGFCFAGTSRARWGGAQLVVQSCSKGDIAAVCHWGDYQPPLSPHILITIDEPAQLAHVS